VTLAEQIDVANTNYSVLVLQQHDQP